MTEINLILINGKITTLDPKSPEVQAIVHEWQQYISEHFYECNKQILSNLGVLYITDERFTTFINRFSSGNLAAFFNEAIQIFCRGSE